VTALGGFGAVNGDLESGIVERLLDARIDYAGDPADLAQDLVGNLAAAVDICAIDLDIERRRQPEIQICVTMSAGRKANVTDGNSRGRSVRSPRT
jgi:hypothetical protein